MTRRQQQMREQRTRPYFQPFVRIFYRDAVYRVRPNCSNPPSKVMFSPVIEVASAHRNKVTAATSSTVAIFASGVTDRACSNVLAGQFAKRVWTAPGDSAFTRISGASARASDFVIVTMPPFDAA